VGASALAGNTSGASNSSLGYQALYSNTTAPNNTAVGYQAGYTQSINGQNTFMGYQSGYSTTSGAYNVAMGSNSLYSAAGSYNVAIGYNAGYNATSASNTFIGQGAGYYVTSGAKNTFLGNYNGNQNGLDLRTLSNRVVLSDGDGNAVEVSAPNGLETRQSGNTTTRQYGMVQQRGTSEVTWSLLTASKISPNAFIYVKVRILMCSPINFIAQEVVGYAMYGSANGVTATGAVTSMTVTSGSNFNGPCGAGTLSWSGGVLSYTTNVGNNYVYYTFFIETSGGDVTSVAYTNY
jgi:hypothetical protein